MKNFDVERKAREEKDRSFTINGETFTYRPAVAPESLMEWSAMVGGEFVERNSDGSLVIEPDTGQPRSSLTEAKAIEIYNNTILAFLEPGQEEKWARVRDPQAPNPINLKDLTDLVQWLFEEMSGRPTGPSSGSSGSTPGGGNGQPATGSTPGSHLQAVVPQG